MHTDDVTQDKAWQKQKQLIVMEEWCDRSIFLGGPSVTILAARLVDATQPETSVDLTKELQIRLQRDGFVTLSAHPWHLGVEDPVPFRIKSLLVIFSGENQYCLRSATSVILDSVATRAAVSICMYSVLGTLALSPFAVMLWCASTTAATLRSLCKSQGEVVYLQPECAICYDPLLEHSGMERGPRAEELGRCESGGRLCVVERESDKNPPTISVLSCRHIFHCQCLEKNREYREDKLQRYDHYCPLCNRELEVASSDDVTPLQLALLDSAAAFQLLDYALSLGFPLSKSMLLALVLFPSVKQFIQPATVALDSVGRMLGAHEMAAARSKSENARKSLALEFLCL